MKIAMILLGLFVAHAAADDSELDKRLNKAIGDCINIMHVNKETFNIVAEGKDYNNKKANCYRTCVLQKLRGIQYGKINVEQLGELVKLSREFTAEDIKEIVEILKTCKGKAEVTKDICEMTGIFMKCSADGIKKAARNE